MPEIIQRIDNQGWKPQIFLPWQRRLEGEPPLPGQPLMPKDCDDAQASQLKNRCTGWSEVGLLQEDDIAPLQDRVRSPIIRAPWLEHTLAWYCQRRLNQDSANTIPGPYDPQHHGKPDTVVMPILLANKTRELRQGALGWLVMGDALAGNIHAGSSILGCGADANLVAAALLQQAGRWGLRPPEHLQLHLGTFDGNSMGLPLMVALIAHALGCRVPQDVCATGAYDLGQNGFAPVNNVPSKVLAAQRWGYRRLLLIDGQPQHPHDDNQRTWDDQALRIILLPRDPIAMIPVILQELWPERHQAATHSMQAVQHLTAELPNLESSFQGRLLATMLQDDFPAAIRMALRLQAPNGTIREALQQRYQQPGAAHGDAQRAIDHLLEHGIAEVNHWANGAQRLEKALATANLLWPCREWLKGTDKVSATRKALMLAFKALSHRGDTTSSEDGQQWLKHADSLSLSDWGLSPAEAWRERTDFWTLRVQVEHANAMDYAGEHDTFGQHLADYDRVIAAMGCSVGDELPVDETRARLLGTLAQAKGFLRPNDAQRAQGCREDLHTCLKHLRASLAPTQAITHGFIFTDLWDHHDQAG
ncbi:MAG: hypothetical protein EA402_13325, partial [Planctomycetota bacterium]